MHDGRQWRVDLVHDFGDAGLFPGARHQQTAVLHNDWVADFLPKSPGAWPRWVGTELYELCDYATKNLGAVVLITSVLGIFFLVRGREYRRLWCWCCRLFSHFWRRVCGNIRLGDRERRFFWCQGCFCWVGSGLELLSKTSARAVRLSPLVCL